MSKLFFDHLLVFEEVEVFINSNATTKEEKEELWKLMDGIVQHRVLDLILSELPREHHDEFMEKFTQFPHEERLFVYLNEKTGKDFEKLIAKEIKLLEAEILGGYKPKKKN